MIETIRVKSGFFRFDRVVVLVLLGYGLIAAVIPDIFSETVLFTASAMIGTAPFITFDTAHFANITRAGKKALKYAYLSKTIFFKEDLCSKPKNSLQMKTQALMLTIHQRH